MVPLRYAFPTLPSLAELQPELEAIWESGWQVSKGLPSGTGLGGHRRKNKGARAMSDIWEANISLNRLVSDKLAR